MIPKRLVVLSAAIVLIAAACGGDSSDSDVSAAATAEAATTDPGEGSSTIETDGPLDLSGGALTSDEGVEVVTEDILDDLDPDVAQAVAPWPTDWSRRTVNIGEFGLGIPRVDPRDIIPPIDLPKFEPITSATWLDDRQPGALVQFNDEVRFYPLAILTRHEIVNDRFGDLPVVVTFCPLCNTAVSFDARVDGQALRFGVSGLLRKSDLVMWDESTTSLWQQITGEGVVGEFAGAQLELIPTSIVSYGDAVETFPEALSLSRDTGFGIEYGTNSYAGYSSSATPFLFDEEPDPRFPALSRVVGVSLNDNDKSYPFSVISTELAVNDEVGGTPIVILWGGDTADALDARQIADSQSIGTGIAFSREVAGQVLTFSHLSDDLFTDAETQTTWTLLGKAIEGPLEGEQLEVVQHRNEFWFAWAGFFPDAPVYAGQ